MELKHLMTLFALVAVAYGTDGTRDPFTCVTKLETNVCWFKNLALNASHPHFTPKSDVETTAVTKVYLGGGHGSHLYTLTSDICEAFPNLKSFDAQLLDLHQVEKDAFSGCHDLEAVNLEVNRLETLNVGIFKNNVHLKQIALGYNTLTSINMQMFEGLNALEQLGLQRNQLKVLPVADMPKLPKLYTILLQDNQLTDFDLTKLYEKAPKMAQKGSSLRLCPGNEFTKTEDPMFIC